MEVRSTSMWKRLVSGVLPAAALWLSGWACASAETVDYVIHISVDGLRSDVLRNLLATTPEHYPNFQRLVNESASTYDARSDFTITETIRNHISMVTGRPTQQPAHQASTVPHGYTNNFPGQADTIHAQGNPELPYVSSVFDVVHDHGLSTAIYASKTRLQILERSYDGEHGAADTVGEDNGTDKIDVAEFTDNSSARIVDSFLANMSADPTRYTFLHLVEPDGAGHMAGWASAPYNESIATVDSRLGQVFDLLEGSPALRDHTALVVTADHGGGAAAPRRPGGPGGGWGGWPGGGGFTMPTDRGHDDSTAMVNYTIPFFVWGAGLAAGSDLYDALVNRFDPVDARPDYDALLQPLWDGDSGNLALALMGLEPIPGSTLVPMLAVDPLSESPRLRAGDADMDLDFDQHDLARVLTAGKYLTGQSATWGDGDWNAVLAGEPGAPAAGDGVFDQRDLVMALAHGNFLTGSYATRGPDGPVIGAAPLANGTLAQEATSTNGTVGPTQGSLTQSAAIGVPEPVSVFLLIVGAGLLFGLPRRTRRRNGAA
jgi:hypothetical protein